MLQVIGKTLRLAGQDLSSDAMKICMASWSKSTSVQYEHHIRDFETFCLSRGVRDFLCVPVAVPIEYLTSLFKQGKSYSTINSARSALSQYVQLSAETGCDFGKHPLTSKFMKGVFKLRPPTAKYNSTWDVSVVLDKLRLVNNVSCTLKDLSYKCVMLLALSTGQRVQSLGELFLSKLVSDSSKIVFCIDSVLKTSKPGVHHSVTVCKFIEDDRICPFTCLNAYLDRTKTIRGKNEKVFISFQKPHHPVSAQSLSRWIVHTLRDCNINSCFTAHSTRSASSSKAALSVSVDSVLRSVGWRSESTFAVFYNKQIRHDDTSFGISVLR